MPLLFARQISWDNYLRKYLLNNSFPGTRANWKIASYGPELEMLLLIALTMASARLLITFSFDVDCRRQSCMIHVDNTSQIDSCFFQLAVICCWYVLIWQLVNLFRPPSKFFDRHAVSPISSGIFYDCLVGSVPLQWTNTIIDRLAKPSLSYRLNSPRLGS